MLCVGLIEIRPTSALKGLNLPEVNAVIVPLGYKRVYLPLYEVADTPFYIQGVGARRCSRTD